MVRHVVTFGRVLREVGIEVGPGRVADAVRASARSISRARRTSTSRCARRSSRGTTSSSSSTARSWLVPARPDRAARPRETAATSGRERREHHPCVRSATGLDPDASDTPLELGASAHELLREKDFAEMTAEEFERARRLLRGDRSLAGRGADRAGERPILEETSSTCGGSSGARFAAVAIPSTSRGRRARRSLGSSSCSATSPARWTRTPARCSSSCTRSSGAGTAWRPSGSAPGSRG